ncbi:MAG: hypothetical protein DMG79_12770, partial [Acidobacteria bacterium]
TGKGGIRRVSKFSRTGFSVGIAVVEAQWPFWTQEQRAQFAGAFAFSSSSEIDENDRRIIDFLIERGNPRIWRKIALLVATNIDRKRAIDFLLAKIDEGSGSLANYYQALDTLSAMECVPRLTDALRKHRAQVDLRPSLDLWENRFIYLDYIACSAALFKLTGDERYRKNLQAMLEDRDEPIRQMARAVAMSSRIAV